MNNKNDNYDPLEEFFRKKSGEYDIPFREEDWQNMEQRLNQQEKAFLYRNKVGLVAAALLILSFLGVFTYLNTSRQLPEHAPIADRTELPPAITPFPDIEPGTPDPETPTDEPGGSDLQSDPEPPELTGVNRVVEESESATPGWATDLNQPMYDTANQRVDPQFLITRKDPGFASPDRINNQELAEVSTHRSDYNGNPFNVDDRPADGMAVQDEFMEYSSRVTIGAFISPNITTVDGFSNVHDIGYNIGMTAEYKITRQLALSTGLVFSNVRYSASRQQYDLPGDGYSETILTPDHIEAICQILDIPVTLKVNILNFNQSRIFTTGSLSSYVMMAEDYSFFYGSGLTGSTESREVRSGDLFAFSNAGVSIGYELDLRHNWSLRAESFLKMPLREVGWSNVKLYSMGGFVSLNVRL